jgi:hypothetical protein
MMKVGLQSNIVNSVHQTLTPRLPPTVQFVYACENVDKYGYILQDVKMLINMDISYKMKIIEFISFRFIIVFI